MRCLLICLLALSLVSCSKGKTDDVYVRIVNNTSSPLESLTVGGTQFGTIAVTNTSEYFKINQPIYVAFCQFTWDGSNKTAGGNLICATPMPPPIDGGHYTYIISGTASPFFNLQVTVD